MSLHSTDGTDKPLYRERYIRLKTISIQILETNTKLKYGKQKDIKDGVADGMVANGGGRDREAKLLPGVECPRRRRTPVVQGAH